MSDDPDHPYRYITELEAEIERLRAALQKVADLIDSEADEPLDDAIAIARRALERKEAAADVDTKTVIWFRCLLSTEEITNGATCQDG